MVYVTLTGYQQMRTPLTSFPGFPGPPSEDAKHGCMPVLSDLARSHLTIIEQRRIEMDSLLEIDRLSPILIVCRKEPTYIPVKSIESVRCLSSISWSTNEFDGYEADASVRFCHPLADHSAKPFGNSTKALALKP